LDGSAESAERGDFEELGIVDREDTFVLVFGEEVSPREAK